MTDLLHTMVGAGLGAFLLVNGTLAAGTYSRGFRKGQ